VPPPCRPGGRPSTASALSANPAPTHRRPTSRAFRTWLTFDRVRVVQDREETFFAVLRSLPNLILTVDDLESATTARRRPSNVDDVSRAGPPPRRKATPASGSGPARRRRRGRDGDAEAGGSAANEGLVTSDEESDESWCSDDDDVGNRSTDELFFLADDDEPRRPPRRRRRQRSPLKLAGTNTLSSPRPTPQASPINSTGVKIVIDRISCDDAEPTVVLGSSTSSCYDEPHQLLVYDYVTTTTQLYYDCTVTTIQLHQDYNTTMIIC